MNQLSSTLPRLPEVACTNCDGYGLKIETERTALCRFCNERNTLAGVVCAHCEAVNAVNAQICAACNLALFPSCPQCGHKNWNGTAQCAQCGHKADALGAVIERAGDTGLRYTERQKQLGAVAAQAEAGSQQRMAYFNDLESQRQAAIAASHARQMQEQRLTLLITFGIVVACIAVLAVAALYSLTR